jgi:hypothetical protein
MVIGITDRHIITAVIDIIARVITTAAIVTTGTDPLDRRISGTATTVHAGITMVAIATGFAGDQASIGAQ